MKEETLYVKGSVFVENYQDFSKDELLKINEITDIHDNQIFQIDPESGVITMKEEVRRGKKVFINSFFDMFNRLYVVANPEIRERYRYDLHYNNRIPTPELSKPMLLSGEFRVTVIDCNGKPGFDGLEMPYTYEKGKIITTQEHKDCLDKLKEKDKAFYPLLIFLVILTSPIAVPTALILFPLIKFTDWKKERDYRRRKAKMA